MLCAAENILDLNLKKKKKNAVFLMILAKFLTKISPKMQNLGQSDPFFFYSLPALNLR